MIDQRLLHVYLLAREEEQEKPGGPRRYSEKKSQWFSTQRGLESDETDGHNIPLFPSMLYAADAGQRD